MDIKTLQKHRLEAMKSGDKTRARFIASLSAEAQNIAKADGNRETVEADIFTAAKRLAKRTNETLSFTSDPDGQRALRYEISVYESFLPQQMTEEQLREVIVGLRETNIGIVMKALKASYDGQYDPKMVKPIIESLTQ